MDNNLYLEGPRLFFRIFSEDDVTDAYCSWMADPVVVRYMDYRRRPCNREMLLEYVRKINSEKETYFFAICLKENKQPIGSIKLHNINWVHRNADVGLMIGDRDSWGKGFATEAFQILNGFAFNTLNLHKLIADVCAENTGSMKALQKSGWRQEAVLREMFYLEGRYTDMIHLSITEDEFRRHDGSFELPADANYLSTRGRQ